MRLNRLVNSTEHDFQAKNQTTPTIVSEIGLSIFAALISDSTIHHATIHVYLYIGSA